MHLRRDLVLNLFSCIVHGQDLEGLIGKLFTSKWLDGDQDRVCMSIIATIKDYAQECQGYLHETYYRKVRQIASICEKPAKTRIQGLPCAVAFDQTYF